ncbi:hypothetical protein GCU56_08465 [Geodermatophilus sabuli]|uniref:Uncharacterized protein n=1 Tax=Geodermatophilus sabuli TaxID=1564158 RepID=A0A7K3VZ75_9ACTN|nr:hypothetical protein [Geodermatophilus sabuli]NEK57902.1 hypothetical protein [Geodermatophilus sabuli]
MVRATPVAVSPSGMSIRGARLGPALVVAALLLCGCAALEGEGRLVAGSSRLTVVPAPAPFDRSPSAPASSSAPAPPDPAAPDPAAPDPAAPDPAAPDPAAPDPAASDADGVDAADLEEAAEAATVTESPMALACADVVGALTDAVVRYEAVALAEGASGGDRTAAAADMRASWQEARAAADRVGAGLPAAAAPALTAVTVLHDGLATRAILDESDADQWRDAREALQDWCRARS